MAAVPRSRGGVCGLLLVVLGAWGALIPFVGPYFHYAFTPDKAWSYSSGRLYLSIVPGAVTVLGGLMVLLTRSRFAGVLGGLLAALAGAWFVVGDAIVQIVLKKPAINPGVPVGNSATGSFTIKMLAEELGFFTGLGIVIVFFAAIAIGRFTMLAARDVAARDAAARDAAAGGYPASTQFPAGPETAAGRDDAAATQQYGAQTDQFRSAEESPHAATQQYPAGSGQYRAGPEGQAATATQHYPPEAERYSAQQEGQAAATTTPGHPPAE